MAYDKKPNYPSLKTPGVYPDGTDKELGLDNDSMEKFSLGSWSSYIFNNKKLDIAPGLTYTDSNINDVVRTNVSEFNETLFGFAYKSDLDITNKNDSGISISTTFRLEKNTISINKGVKPKIAVLREQGVNGQLEMAAAFDRVGFDCIDVHMQDLIDNQIID